MGQMDWDAIREIFNTALDLPRNERESYVRTASRGNEEMYSAIESLLKTEESLGGFLEKPFGYKPPPPSAIRPGDLLCERFRIQRLIGEGGMGHVYEAWDIELGRPVALKAIRPEIAQQPEALKRFRREVSVALAITHPNVCRTFDIKRDTVLLDPAHGNAPGNSAEIIFLTMEFLPGETLAAKIARDGAIPLDQALPLATQIGEALTCAHNLGIYHRDIKPANVMLVPANQRATDSSSESLQPKAVLTDFGLARQQALFRTDDFSAFSQSGAPIGTLSYMAPEQLEGKPTSAATDIYAFGLVLHEMITGQRVFPSSNPLSHLAERLNAPAPSPRRLQPNLPEAWHQAIEGCLRLDPATRFQSATEVLTVLHGGHVPLPSLAYSNFPIQRPTPNKFSLQNWSRRRKLTAAMISLAVMSLFAYALRLYITKADAAVTPGALVYMTQVKNDTGEKSFDNLSELMQAGLTQSAHINLLDQGRVGDILQQMTKAPDTVITEPIAREIAMRTGAVRVIFPKVSGHNGSYKLDIDIQQPDNTPNRYRDHWPKSFTWQSTGNTNPGTIPAELLTTIRNTSDWIRKEVGESANDIARLNAPLEDVTTSSWAALSEFVLAESLQHKQASADAIVTLQNAVQIDPHFSIAWARLGDLLVGEARYQEGYKAYGQALSEDQQERLTRRERDRIKGAFAMDSGDYTAAEAAYRDYTNYYENDYKGWYYRAYPLQMLGRPEEAVNSLKKAYAIDPSLPNAPWEFARSYTYLGNFDEALRWSSILRAKGQTASSFYFDGTIHFLKAEYNESLNSFREIQKSSRMNDPAWSFTLSARLEAERGNYLKALELLDQGIHEDQSHGLAASEADKWIDKAYVESDLGQFDQSMTDVSLGLSLDASPQRISAASSVLGRSFTLARGASKVALQKALLSLEERISSDNSVVINEIARHRVRGEVLLTKGQGTLAIGEMRKASELDAPIHSHEYLGRALAIEARKQPDVRLANELRKEARDAFAVIALHPNVAWLQQSEAFPGFYGDNLETYLKLKVTELLFDSQLGYNLQSFAKLREKEFLAFPDFPQTLASIQKESYKQKVKETQNAIH